MSDDLTNISVVLVETFQAGNIGSAARAMKNMGLKRLKLVAPPLLNEECRRMAPGAWDVVEQAGHYSTLDEALEEEQVVVGTTSHRARTPRQRVHTPREIAPVIRSYLPSARVALVFGPERAGLDDRRLSRCQYLVTIPASPEHAVLNVAQSVLVLAYEIFTSPGIEVAQPVTLAGDEERRRMFDHLETTLHRIGFFSSGNKAHMMKALRRLLGRSDLTRRDVRIVRGIMSQMDWFAENSSQRSPGPGPGREPD